MHDTLLILPDFALILFGFGLRRVLQLGYHFWSGLEKLIYLVPFPALLFNALAKSHIDFRVRNVAISESGKRSGSRSRLGCESNLTFLGQSMSCVRLLRNLTYGTCAGQASGGRMTRRGSPAK
jgi:hypothetical protein